MRVLLVDDNLSLVRGLATFLRQEGHEASTAATMAEGLSHLSKQAFDLVFLDPPRYAKSIFGVVDVVNDYPALFKPALLSTAEGGTLICCNNVAEVEREGWLAQLQRSAVKAGREIREFEWIVPETDFPSPDGQPPLKMVLLRV